jgi:hypothetical protein
MINSPDAANARSIIDRVYQNQENARNARIATCNSSYLKTYDDGFVRFLDGLLHQDFVTNALALGGFSVGGMQEKPTSYTCVVPKDIPQHALEFIRSHYQNKGYAVSISEKVISKACISSPEVKEYTISISW